MSTVTALAAVMETEHYSPVEARGAPAADDEFVEANLKRVFRLIYRVVGNVPDAQDLTQEAFVKALSRRSQLQDPKKSAQWLGRIAVNTALDFVRRRKRVVFEELDHGLPHPPVAESYPWAELTQMNRRASSIEGLAKECDPSLGPETLAEEYRRIHGGRQDRAGHGLGHVVHRRELCRIDLKVHLTTAVPLRAAPPRPARELRP